MKFGINQWCFPAGTELEQIFAQAGEAGFDGVELNLLPEGEKGLTMASDDQEVRKIADLARRYGMPIPSIATGLHWNFPLTSPDPEVRATGRRVVEKMLHVAALVGADTVLVVPGLVTGETSYDQAFALAREALRGLAPVAEKHQVHIGVENVWNKFLPSPLEFAGFVDAIGSPCVGAYFDVGNVLAFGFPEQWIRILGKRIRKVHVKDFRPEIGNIRGFTSLLNGEVNWPQVAVALAEIGYADFVTAELAPYRFYPEQLIPDTAAHLRRIFGKMA